MSNLVIVALPAELDPVWEISSEKKPHLTLLFLGDTAQVPDIAKILDFTGHAASTSLKPFSLDVDYRGVLGADNADVLFYKKTWGFKEVNDFRNQLLQFDPIKKAFDSVTQFPEWQPHLTLGYPTAPAKKTDRGLYYTDFDRIAVWVGDFEGPEFRLQYNFDPLLEEVSMSAAAAGEKVVQELLHYGVKGMKWGVRRDRSPRPVTTKTKSTITGRAKVKTKGGGFHPPHEDAVKAAVSKQKIRKSGMAALSNNELRDLASRMNLEQQVRSLRAQEPPSETKKVLSEIQKDPKKRQALSDVGKAVVTKAAKKSTKVAAVAAL